MNKLKEEFDKLSDDQYNVSWNDKVEITYLKDYINFLEQKIEALSQHDVSVSDCVLNNEYNHYMDINTIGACSKCGSMKQYEH